ncbi:MAG: UTP--glucose-1-phosphate uridylyltransferase GalU [Candidatus Pacebacteria bacterium]|nr:UTP--glucose-1-phosphate uridylyltransferase GalU [Candidatus Paceibacterota bacterium]
MVRKAVIPAAGFGTRFLPATKSQPKEMLPIVDTPTIQYVVEEAVASGIRDILMIIGKSKRAIEEFFDRNFELEAELEAKGKTEDLERMRHISDMANVHFVWQKQMRGLGDAVAHAKDHVGNEPFAILLGDTIFDAQTPVLGQLLDVFDRYQEPVVALEKVPKERVSRYGVIQGKAVIDGTYLIEDFVEKPAPEEAPSDMAIAGRYVFTPEIFSFLDKVKPGKNGEIQLTDAMRMMVKSRAMYGLQVNGKRQDIGNKLDYIKTNILYGLRSPDISSDLKTYIKEIARDL